MRSLAFATFALAALPFTSLAKPPSIPHLVEHARVGHVVKQQQTTTHTTTAVPQYGNVVHAAPVGQPSPLPTQAHGCVGHYRDRRGGPTIVVLAPAVTTWPLGSVLWQDTADLSHDTDWSVVRFDPPPINGDLLFQLEGSAVLDSVELTFTDGSARTLRFQGGVLQPGTYEITLIAPMQPVDTIRVVAHAEDDTTQLTAEIMN